jgi:hypothetical protein
MDAGPAGFAAAPPHVSGKLGATARQAIGPLPPAASA